MSVDRLLTALIIGLLATSIGSSLAAFHLYQLGLEQFPQVSDLDDDIGVLGMDLFQRDDPTFDVDSIVAQLLGMNSTGNTVAIGLILSLFSSFPNVSGLSNLETSLIPEYACPVPAEIKFYLKT